MNNFQPQNNSTQTPGDTRGFSDGNNLTEEDNAGRGRLRGDLPEQIRALCFVKKELELYLDTHPDCKTALDYYYRTLRELRRLTEQYENTVGPLTSAGVVSMDQWTWVKQPWPWQRRGDYMEPREGR